MLKQKSCQLLPGSFELKFEQNFYSGAKISTLSGFQHLQLNKSSKYRRNAMFFCQIPISFTLYMLYNYSSLYLIWR